MSKEKNQVDSSECEREPIHIPGFTQPFGVLVAFSLSHRVVTYVSANCQGLLGEAPEAILGRDVGELFVQPDRDRLVARFDALAEGGRDQVDATLVQGQPISLSFHVHNGHLLLEIEANVAELGLAKVGSRQVDSALDRLHVASDVQALGEIAVQEIQTITGYDRVMLYKFDERWNGNVVAEALSDRQAESYLGHWFPAEDIPKQARQLFYDNWVRMIPDAKLEPVRLLSSDSQPLDMARSILRSPSPIHLEYLVNMDVAASFTISIRRAGKLWGLIACHHCEPKVLHTKVRKACEIVGQLVSALIGSKETFDDAALRHKLTLVHNRLVENMKAEVDFAQGLVGSSPNLLDLTNSDGAAAALYFEGKWTVIGNVPEPHQIDALVHWLKGQNMRDGIFHTSELAKIWPAAADFKKIAAGLIAVSIPKSRDNFILWFRPELVQTVTWAGDPKKSLIRDAKTMRLHPRKSFSTWKQEVRDTALAWRQAELEAAADLRRSVIEIDLERQFKKERAARAEADSETRRMEFLADLSKALSASLDYDTVLETSCKLALGTFCDWTVLSFHEEGGLKRTSICHAQEAGHRVAQEMFAFAPFKVKVAENDTEGVLVSKVDREFIESYAVCEKSIDFLQNRLRISSYIAMPLTSRGKTLGVMEFVRSENPEPFAENDLRLAQEIARRVAMAIDNARLFRATRDLYERAEKARKVKEEVLAIVSHDLKNPARSVSMNVQMAERVRKSGKDAGSAQFDHFLESIHKSAEQMKGLIQDLLDITKLEANLKLEMELAPFDGRSLIEEVISVLEPLASANGQQIVFHAEGRAIVFGDKRRLSQVASNLIGNAIKFSGYGTVIRVAVAEHGNAVRFKVADKGPGIEPQFLAQVFDRFWQGSRTSRDGLGLGLAIARGIVEAHDGKLWVESEFGQGATFHFEIPIVKAP